MNPIWNKDELQIQGEGVTKVPETVGSYLAGLQEKPAFSHLILG